MPAPLVTTADGYIGESFVTVHMDVPLDAANPPPTSAFDLNINGISVSTSSVTVDSAAQTVTLGVSGVLLAGDIVLAQYFDPTPGNDANAVQALDGTDAANFSYVFIVFTARPGPAAPAAPSLDVGSDTGATGDGITSDSTPTVSGTAAANNVVKLYDTDGTTLLGTTTADGSGNWSITSSALGDGSHTLKVTQTDGGSNTSPLSSALTVNIDTTAAAPTALAVASGSDSGTPGDGISNAGTPVITGHAEANATVSLYDTDGTTVLGTTTANGAGNWSITSSMLVEGQHTLTAKQTDAAGNVSAASSGFTYVHDTIGPVNMALSTTSAQMAAATNGATVAALSSTDLTAVHYGFAVGNGSIDADNGKFTISGNNLVAAQNLTAGSYHIYLSATDAAGNDAFQVFTFTVTNAPSVAGIVRAGAGTVPASAATVDYTVTFDQAVTGVDASDFALTSTGTAAGAVASVTGSGTTYTVTVGGIAGDGDLRLDLNPSGTGIQNAGGTAIGGGYTAGQTYALDHTAPAAPAALTALPGGDTGSSNADGISAFPLPTILGHAAPNATVNLYDTDGTTLLGTTTADGTGAWTITSSILSEGAHTLTAKQVDAAGNVSAASAGLTWEVDTTPPTPLGLSRGSVPIGQAGNGATVATFAATDAHAVTYSFVAGNGTVDADNAKFTIDGNALVASQNLAPGTYHVYVQALDAAGNTSIEAVSFDVIGAPGVGSIARAAAAPALTPAAATSVSYTVTFDQAVTGVDASDFALAATGTAAGTIAAVTGSGTTYTVTVDGIAGDGNLRLDLNPSGTGIQNAGGTAVASGYTEGQTFALDHTAPAAPAAFAMTAADDTGVSNADAVTSVAAPHFSGTAEALATVNLYDTDGTTLLGTTTADGSGNWTIASATLGAGAHTLTVRQTDAAGNVSAAGTGLAVTIDATAAALSAPVLATASDTGLAGDGITASRTPTVTGSAEAFAAVRLYDTDGTTVLGTATADAAGHWSIVSSSLGDGAHALTVKQTDPAGNVSAAGAALNLTVDATAPAAPSTPALATASDTGAPGDGITNVTQPVVTGSAEALAAVKLYDTDGTTVLGTATADGSGHWSIASGALALGHHLLTATQVDAAGNVSAASAALNLTVVAPPAPPATTVDGVQVDQQTATLPGGGSGTQTTIPIVTTGRVETTGNAGVADIPLSTANGSTVLLAQVGPGFGLTSTGGASVAAGSAAEQLIQAILASATANTAADQQHLTGNGQSFLDLLPSQVPLLVQTVTPVTAAGATDATLTLTGTSSASQHTALVIDATHVGAGNTLTLNNVDFAAVIGAATVVGATHGQTLAGDAANQTLVVGAGQASSLLAGGGNDTLRLDAAAASGNADGAARADARAATATLMHGGDGADTAVFSGQMASYTIENHDGHVVVTANGGTHDQAFVVNVETLQFADTSVTVQNRAALSAIAGLYADILGRQADVSGFEFWGNAEKSGASLGQIAVAMIGSTEGQGRQQALNGDAAHDIAVLYQAMFHRAEDAGGAAFWLDAMQHGENLQQVADQMMHSAEIVGHALDATQWNFVV